MGVFLNLDKAALLSVDVEHLMLDAKGGTLRFLDLFDRFGVKATFFMTGEVLAGDPSIADAILSAGHELASHGYTKTTPGGPYLRQMAPEALERELVASKEMFIERGYAVRGFRAPALSMSRDIQERLADHFEYDSSVSTGGGKTYPGLVREVGLVDGMLEIPVSRIGFSGLRASSSNLMGLGALGAKALLALAGVPSPFAFYAHSFDLGDADATTLGAAGWKNFLYFGRCGQRQAKLFENIISLLASRGFSFPTYGEYVDAWKEQNAGQ